MQHPASRATHYFAEAALVEGEVLSDVTLGVSAEGRIISVESGQASGAESLGGIAVPGMPNVHSHAFQRAMAGLAERAGPEGDNFWRWREVMYRFLARLSPDDVEAVAAQLYVECLKHGYTGIGEFHYLHNDSEGRAYADPAELSHRIVAAAQASGIRLTLLPVLYQTSDFGGAPAAQGQRRFTLATEAYGALVSSLASQYGRDPMIRLGVAPHSLRAVPPDALKACGDIAAALGSDAPIHMHAAEQVKEVEDCLAWSGGRPVEWLLENAPVDARWCLIHSTHLEEDERRALGASRAVVGLCPTTEANLGDGIFPFREYLAEGGRFGIGSDSNVSTSPVEELRLIEYVRRLETRARNVTETRIGASVGLGLVRRALGGGAQALGWASGGLAPGAPADLVVLDPEHPALLGRRGDALLDAWIFNGNASPVRHVMVGGRWVVRDGNHVREDEIVNRYRRTMRALAA